MIMTIEAKLALMEDRANKLANNPKDIKAPGVLKKLNRQIRAIKKSLQ